MPKGKQHPQQFKEDAVRYYHDHKDIGINGCAKNLNISNTTLSNWIKAAQSNNGAVPTRGSGNYSSDIERENARLKRELRDAQDALDVLKKAINILGN